MYKGQYPSLWRPVQTNTPVKYVGCINILNTLLYVVVRCWTSKQQHPMHHSNSPNMLELAMLVVVDQLILGICVGLKGNKWTWSERHDLVIKWHVKLHILLVCTLTDQAKINKHINMLMCFTFSNGWWCHLGMWELLLSNNNHNHNHNDNDNENEW